VSLCCGGGFVPERNKASPELLHFATHLLTILTSDHKGANQELSIRTAAAAASEPIDEDFLFVMGYSRGRRSNCDR
jgi:hypothetical protein